MTREEAATAPHKPADNMTRTIATLSCLGSPYTITASGRVGSSGCDRCRAILRPAWPAWPHAAARTDRATTTTSISQYRSPGREGCRRSTRPAWRRSQQRSRLERMSIDLGRPGGPHAIQPAQATDIDEFDHCSDDNGCERGLQEELEQTGQEQQCDDHQHRNDQTADLGLGASATVDSRLRQAAIDDHA